MKISLITLRRIVILGIVIDSKLHFDAHCVQCVRKAAKILHFIFTCFITRDIPFMVRLYRTFVLPVLEYGVLVYHPRTVRNIKLLESVQRNFTRRLLNDRPELTYSERLRELNLDSLELRRIILDLVEVYKIIYGHTDLDFNKFFKFAKTVGTRSNGLKLEISFCKSEIRKHFFSNRVVRIWNALPNSAVTAKSISQFKEFLVNEPIKAILRRFCKCY